MSSKKITSKIISFSKFLLNTFDKILYISELSVATIYLYFIRGINIVQGV